MSFVGVGMIDRRQSLAVAVGSMKNFMSSSVFAAVHAWWRCAGLAARWRD
jgi:hypothetical protein